MICRCTYCNALGNQPWLWKLGDNYWFEIPKNASYAIKRKYNLERNYLDDIQPLPFDPNIEKVYYVWRDPVERFSSLFSHYFVAGNKRIRHGQSFLRRLNHNPERLSLEEKVEICLSWIDKFTDSEERHHFFPQHAFLDFRYNLHKLTLENLNESPLGPLKVENATHRRLSVLPALEKYVDDIKSIYAEDYNL